MHSLDFSLCDVTITVLTFCCPIPGMCSFAFLLCDITIKGVSLFLFIRDFKQLKSEGFFLILIASMFLNYQGSIHQGDNQFRDKSRE